MDETKTQPEFAAPKFGFRTSADIGEIAAALVAAQSKFGAAIKDSSNPAYRSKYADLSAVIEATQKPLNDNGIAVLQAPQLDGQMVTVTTRLQHKSGQWYESDLTLPAVQRDRFDAQSVGSAITYARRYSLQAITGLATEDDDGNAASGIGAKEAAQAVAKRKLAEAAKSDDPKVRAIAERAAKACLFYDWFDESQTAKLTGDKELMKEHWKALKPFWRGDLNAVVLKAQELEDMKYYFEQKGVEFRPLQAAS
jgi:ERF superfamily protein